VTVSDGQGGTASDSCDITVEMKFGSIDIKSSPDGAAVYLDGVDTGNITPFVITNVLPGSHTVMLAVYHYKYREQTITVTANETTYLNWSLTYASEQTLTIQPDATAGKDALVSDDDPSTNYGTYNGLHAGSADWGGIAFYRSYLQFSLDSLPEDAVIVSAKVGLWFWGTLDSVVAPIGIYNVTGSWSETGITWNNQPASTTTPEYTSSLPAMGTANFVYWYISNLAKGWWDGSLTNYGVMLKDTDESTVETWKYFLSSDYANASQHPTLTIVYYVPTS
jgi:hypothetical protein